MAGLFDASRLYEALKEANLLPTYSGIFSGYFDPSTNRMTGATPRTQAHEMTHAVQWNLLMDSAKQIQKKKREGSTISQQEEQFLQGIQKMYGDSFGTVGQRDLGTKKRQEQSQSTKEAQLKGMYKPSGEVSEDSYRTGRRELEAFGIGEFAKGSDGYYDKQPHLNATMAQEFDILFSLYQSLPKDVRQSFSKTKKSEIEKMIKGGYGDPKLNALDFEEFRTDPFKPTIK